MLRSTAARRRVQSGDVVFVLFLAAYAALSLSRIPFDFRDLSYLFSLEQGRWVMQEWVHPLYVPALAGYRAILGWLGYDGRMLVPIEFLNLTLLLSVLALLYRLARRISGNPMTSALAIAVAGLCHGFWQSSVRPTPYAPALLCLVGCLRLLIDDRPVSPRRYAAAGVLAGLATGLHASAMSLALVAVACAFSEPDPRRTFGQTRRRVLSFGVAMLVTVVAGLLIFVRFRGLDAAYLRHLDWHGMFLGIEQVPGSSIYTSGGPFDQLTSFAFTIARQALELVIVAAVILTIALPQRRRTSPAGLERRLHHAAWANAAAIAAFFLINNTHNGFIFASLALVPVVVAVVANDSPIAGRTLLWLAPLSMIVSLANLLTFGVGGRRDPQLDEVRFLQSTLGPRDVLIVPGALFPEMLYLSHFNVWELRETDSQEGPGDQPLVRPDATLAARIELWRSHGSRVLFALGDDTADFVGDPVGAAKERQIFWRPETLGRERAPKMEGLRASLQEAGIRIGAGPVSPQGYRYAELSAASPEAPPAQPQGGRTAAELAGRLGAVTPIDSDGRRQRLAYLATLESRLPEDPWIACDVMRLVCRDFRDVEGAGGCRPLAMCEIEGVAPAPAASASVVPAGCHWSAAGDTSTVEGWLRSWSERAGLGAMQKWDLRIDGSHAQIELVFPSGRLDFEVELQGDCSPTVVTRKSSPAGALAATPEQEGQLIRELPIPRVPASTQGQISPATKPSHGVDDRNLRR